MAMTLKEIMLEAYNTACEKGWYDGGLPPIPERLALIHSEVSEALEEYRAQKDIREVYYEGLLDKPVGFPSELADIIIRVCDMAEAHGIDLESVVRKKMEFNKTRPYKHGGKVC